MPFFDRFFPAPARRIMQGPLRRLFVTTFFNCLGNGMAFSMFVVYLHNVRGFSTTFATLLLAGLAIAGLAIGPMWGTLIDRVGPGVVGIVGYCGSALALLLWTGVHTHRTAIAVAVLLTLFEGAGWGSGMVMMTRLVPDEDRTTAYGMNFMMVNLGIGMGLLVSATLANIHNAASFTLLYRGDAGVTLIAAAVFATLLRHGAPVPHDVDEHGVRVGWKVVLADRRLRYYVLASIVLLIGGYGSVESGLSLFIVNNVHLSVHVIGLTFFCNTVTVVLGQMWVLNRVARRSRSAVMALVGLLWCVFWFVLAGALAMPAVVATVTLCGAQVLFAVGETMLQPSGSAIINEIAPDHLRGRYNAAAGASWGITSMLAPALTAAYYDVHLGNWWPVGTGVMAVLGAALMYRLRHQLTDVEDGRQVPLKDRASKPRQ